MKYSNRIIFFVLGLLVALPSWAKLAFPCPGHEHDQCRPTTLEELSKIEWKSTRQERIFLLNIALPGVIKFFSKHTESFTEKRTLLFPYRGKIFEEVSLVKTKQGKVEKINIQRWSKILSSPREAQWNVASTEEQHLHTSQLNITAGAVQFEDLGRPMKLGLKEWAYTFGSTRPQWLPRNLFADIHLDPYQEIETIYATMVEVESVEYPNKVKTKGVSFGHVFKESVEEEKLRQHASNIPLVLLDSRQVRDFDQLSYYISTDLSKLYIKIGEHVFVLDSAETVSYNKLTFQTKLINELALMLDLLQTLRPQMRAEFYQRTYQSIEQNLRGLSEAMEKNHWEHLEGEVQNQFESIYFMYKNILAGEITQDKNVRFYGQAVGHLCDHLEYCNQNFFQFNANAPSSAVIALIAKHVGQMYQKAQELIDKHGLAQAAELKEALSGLFAQIFELSVARALGDADATLLNQLDQYLAAEEKISSTLDEAFMPYPDLQVVQEQAKLGASFLRKIRQ